MVKSTISKAFLGTMLTVVRPLADVRKWEIMVMTSLWAESYLLITPITLANLSHETQNSNQQAPDATSFFPVGGMPTASSLAWRAFSEKSGRCVLQQIKERGAHLWLIVVISVRQSTVAAISGLHCRALVMVSSSIRLTAWLQNSKAGGTVREIDVKAESPRLSPLWDYPPSPSSACHGLLIIAIDNAITYKYSAGKNAKELKLADATITDMQMRQRDVLRSMQNTRRS